MVLCSEPEKNDTFVGKLLPSTKVNRSTGSTHSLQSVVPEMVCHNSFAMPSSVLRRRTSARASYRASKALCFLLVLFFQAPMQLRRNDAPRLPQHLTRLGIPYLGALTNFLARSCVTMCVCNLLFSLLSQAHRFQHWPQFRQGFNASCACACVVATGDAVICLSYRNSATRVPTVCLKADHSLISFIHVAPCVCSSTSWYPHCCI